MEALTITRDSELLKKTEGLIEEAAALDIDLGRLGLGKKIESIKKSIEGDISIVFLGNISDGKTSIIAGCAGRVLDGMDIRADESTDEVRFYPELAAQGFVPADTPGLFGTKEKDEGGEKIRFSEKTERFVSEAGVVIFVCDAGAGAPIKNSCGPLIKKNSAGFRSARVDDFRAEQDGHCLQDDRSSQFSADERNQERCASQNARERRR